MDKDNETETSAFLKNDPVLNLAKKGNENLKWDDEHICYFCKKKISTRKQLKRHIKRVHTDLMCIKSILRMHKVDKSSMNAVPKVDPFLNLAKKGNENVKYEDAHTCCFCKKKLSNRSKLMRHFKRVHLICDKSRLEKSLDTKNEIRKRRCKHCTQEFHRFENLRR